MTTIHKYSLEITDTQVIQTPHFPHPLSVQEQGGRLVLWAAVDTSRPMFPMTIRIVGTGNPFGDSSSCVHIGTVQMPNGLVWHVFRKGEQ